MKNVVLNRYPLGNKRFIWKQKDLILSTFQCHATDIEKCIKNLKEAGFNMVEMGWMPHEQSFQAVDLCEKYGLDVLFQDFGIMSGMQHNYVDRKVDESVARDLVEKLKDKKHTVGYYVWDEPYHDNELEEAKRQSDMLEKYAPEACLFTVAIPSYNLDFTWENGLFPEYLEKFIKVMEPPVLSLDFYPVGLGSYTKEKELDDTLMWCDLGLMRNLCKKYDLPLWFYYQGCPVYDRNVYYTYPMTTAMLYGSVIYGAKGLQFYTAIDNAVVDKDGEKAQYFESQKKTHAKLNAWGNTLMALDSKLVYHSAELLPDCKFMEGLADKIEDSEILACELPHRTSVGELEDAYGNKYMVILNRAFFEELNTTLKLKGAFNIYQVSDSTGKQTLIAENATELKVDLPCGEAMLIRVQPANEEKCTVEYVLAE
ncbi:MAG: hypothetical protein IKB86_05035 [Clostridia bacterium]|nr:hypothetical protein [Clostridia bacterium]